MTLYTSNCILKKILFIASHRKDRAPNQRFRFEQYIAFLESNGYRCELSNIINSYDDKFLYKSGNYIFKAYIALKAIIIRLRDLYRRNKYDIIFICREAFLTGTTFFERNLINSKSKIVFDFDDAIWHLDVSEANKSIGWLKAPRKTEKIIRLADLVFAGNNYLMEYAFNFNDNVKIIPTTIDTQKFDLPPRKASEVVCIGWTGSMTTIKHFAMAIPALQEIKRKYKEKVIFRVIGDPTYVNQELNIRGIKWTAEDEVFQLSAIDIGIMPLPDDEWSNGKCACKGLQYMALRIATVMSPVGVNTDIIQDGVNGFLADKTEEWVDKLSLLIDDSNLRRTLADNGRTTVLEKYSVKANAPLYLKYFNELTK